MRLQRQLTLSHLFVTGISVAILLIGALAGYTYYLRSDLPAVQAADLALFYADEYVYLQAEDEGFTPQGFVDFELFPVSDDPAFDDWMIISDREGVVIASNHPEVHPIGSSVLSSPPFGMFPEDYEHPETFFVDWESGENAFYSNLDGRHIGYAPLIDLNEEWIGYLYFHVADEDIRFLQARLARYGLAIAAGLILIALVAAGVMSNYLAGRFGKQLQALETASSAFAAGDYHKRVEVSGQNEIGQLGLSYNQMADTIQTQMGELRELAETNAKLASEAEGLARLEERNRLARDLHDAVKQQLFGLNLALGSLPKLLESKPGLANKRIGQLIEQTQQIQGELDGIIHQLRPVSLSDQGLISAVEALTAQWENQTGTPVELSTNHSRPLSIDIEQAAYRLIQEALQNIGKHAEASRVELTLNYDQHQLQLEIKDNGKGFDLAAPSGSGYGLSNMRQRIEQLDGTFGIDTAPQKGCTITATIPIKKNGQD